MSDYAITHTQDTTPALDLWEPDRNYCPSCGRADVVVGLDRVLLETSPTVRRHACGVGGPGSEVVG